MATNQAVRRGIDEEEIPSWTVRAKKKIDDSTEGIDIEEKNSAKKPVLIGN